MYKKYLLQSRKKITYPHFLFQSFRQEIVNLTKRLLLQAIRRPAHIIAGLIQPLLWLILFGALFKDIPLQSFNPKLEYNTFLNCGIIIFTCFTGSLNAGLPLIFDREFGFLNRLLVTPIISKNSILLATMLFIICTTMLQTLIILSYSVKSFAYILYTYRLYIILTISLLITTITSSISLSLAFILPGHIEFLAFILIINLPMLFASTALAPLYFMPHWLQMLAKINILTYAIEATRYIAINTSFNSTIIETMGLNFSLNNIFQLLLFINFSTIIIITKIINKKLE
jgi:ABC-2 type transport system permease protein